VFDSSTTPAPFGLVVAREGIPDYHQTAARSVRAEEVADQLKAAGVRYHPPQTQRGRATRNEKMNAQIREHCQAESPFLSSLGDKEAEAWKMNVAAWQREDGKTCPWRDS